MWILRLFGTASLEGPTGPLGGRATHGRRMALLAILALARGRAVTRDRLIALLWPESPADRARRYLSDTLYIVRTALADDVIRSVGDDLIFDAQEITSDVERFARLLAEERLEAAMELVGGPLLDGFHLSGTAEFEHWLDGERAQVDQRCDEALEALAGERERSDDFAGAAAWWRRRAARDPWSGRVALRLMRALDAAGDRAGALQHARVHAALLRDDFDTEPDPDVEALAEQLRRAPSVRVEAAGAAQPARTTPDERPSPASPGRRSTRAFRERAALGVLLLVVLGTSFVVRRARTGTADDPPRSIAVLPFINLSADPRNVYFSDGLTEQIITAVSRIDGLRVAARTSSFALRDLRLDARTVGDTLGVAAVLEGGVLREGERLRITAQLIDASTGYHIWSEAYDRELRDIFDVQEEIAAAIAAALELRLVGTVARSRSVANLEAYDMYLRGLLLRNSLSEVSLRQAAEYFDRTIALEPEFALAYAAKASVVAPLIYFGALPLEEGLPHVRALTARALDLDPGLGEAHAMLGLIQLFFDWDWPAAEPTLRRAIALNPNDAHAWHHLANYLHTVGRFGEAAAAHEQAAALDPLNPRTHITLGADYVLAGDDERALAQFRRAVQLDPGHPLRLGLGPGIPRGPGFLFLVRERYDDAVEDFVRVAMLRGANRDELDALRTAYAASGMPGFWRAWLEMDRRLSGNDVDALRLATLLALAGDTAQAFDWLDRAFVERNPGLIFLGVEPALRHLRAHPRILRILEGMNYPKP